MEIPAEDRDLGVPAVTPGSAARGDGRLATFAYHETPFGMYVELVDTAAKGFYPQWFTQALGAPS